MRSEVADRPILDFRDDAKLTFNRRGSAERHGERSAAVEDALQSLITSFSSARPPFLKHGRASSLSGRKSFPRLFLVALYFSYHT
jgi:hypothetical protein